MKAVNRWLLALVEAVEVEDRWRLALVQVVEVEDRWRLALVEVVEAEAHRRLGALVGLVLRTLEEAAEEVLMVNYSDYA